MLGNGIKNKSIHPLNLNLTITPNANLQPLRLLKQNNKFSHKNKNYSKAVITSPGGKMIPAL